MIDYRLRRHLSLSFGINVNFEKEDYSNSDYNGITYDFRTYSEKTVLFEFPVQLNYHFRDTSKIFNPYIKLGLRNSFYHRDFVISPENLSYPYTRYFLLMDLGLGSYLKVSNHLSLIYEASIGFGLKYLRSDYVYLEGLIGLRYTLK
jgi:outer membrane protein W